MAPGLRIDVADLPARTCADTGTRAETQRRVAAGLDRELAQTLARASAPFGGASKGIREDADLLALQHNPRASHGSRAVSGGGRNTLTRKIQELKLDPDKRESSVLRASSATDRRLIRGFSPLRAWRRCGTNAGRGQRGDIRMWSMLRPWFFG